MDDLRGTSPAAAEALRAVLAAIDAVPGGPPPVAAVRDALVAASTDDAALATAVADLTDVLGALLDAVTAARTELDRVAAERVVPFSDAWWQRRARDLRTGPAGQRTRAWVGAYVEALLARRPDVAAALCDPSRGLAPQDEPDLVAAARAAADALADGRLPEVVPVVRRVLDGPWADGLPIGDRVDLEVLLARGAIRSGAGTREAQARLERAAAAAARYGGPALESRLVAVLGECLLAEGDTEAARAELRRAVDLAGDEPAGLVGLALLEERAGRWSRATALYDRAAAAVVGDVTVLERLHAPTTGNLHWRLSRQLSQDLDRAEEALAALDRALELGMAGTAGHQERRAFVDKAHLLERLQRPAEAARAYAEAGDRYSQDGDQATARGYLERSISLDGTDAVVHWGLAEVLRLHAQLPDGTVDVARVRAGVEAWDAGRALRPPAADEAWVHLVHGLLRRDDVVAGHGERHRAWTAAGDVECAVVLDDGSVQAWAFLSLTYLELGLVGCALHAAQRARHLAPGDDLAAYATSRALAAAGRLDEAVAAAADLGPPWAGLQVPLLHVLQDRPDAALAALDEGGADAEPRVRSVCLAHAGRDAEAAAAVAHLWPVDGAAPDPADRQAVAWVGYLLGYLDRAAELLEQVLADGPADPASALSDLGLVLLARGGADDLRRGPALVRDGIDRCLRWDTLRLLRCTELPGLLRRTATAPHAAAVRALAGELDARCATRTDTLRRADPDAAAEARRGLAVADPHHDSAHDPAHDPDHGPDHDAGDDTHDDAAPRRVACRAVLARLAAEAGDASAALEHYRALAREGFAESRRGVVRTATALCGAQDELVRTGAPLADASAAWVDLFGALDEELLVASTDDGPDRAGDDREELARLRAGLALRAALCAVLLGQRGDAVGWLSAAGAGSGRAPGDADADAQARAVVDVLVRAPEDYWTVTDALTAVRDDPAAPAEAVAAAERLAGAARLDVVYRMRRADVDSTTTFPLESPVVVRLGDGLVVGSTGPGWTLFRRLVPELRERVRARTGVTVPGLRFRGGAGLPADGFAILWEQEPVASGTVTRLPRSDADTAGLEEVVDALEVVLRRNVARLLGPDDLTAWVQERGLDEAAQASVDATLLADRTSRLRTHRVLRALLREGVSLADGAEVLAALAGSASGAPRDPVRLTADVRVALAEALPGAAAPAAALPADLEQRVAAALTGDEDGTTAWQAPWADARELVARVRGWWRSAPAGPDGTPPTVVVGDPAVRAYLWRLLAAGGDATAVLTQAERDAARGRGDAGGPTG